MSTSGCQNAGNDMMRCILHIGPDTSDTIRPISDESWEVIKRIAESRRQGVFKNSKYTNVCHLLPDKYEQYDGYHAKCYRQFTALSKKASAKQIRSTRGKKPLKQPTMEGRPTLRSQVIPLASTSAGVFRNKCLFCLQFRKRVPGGKFETPIMCASKEAEKSIRKAANDLNDEVLLARLGDVDFIAKKVRYHEKCRKAYLTDSKRKSKKCDKRISLIHQKAFQIVKDHVDRVIDQNGGVFLTRLLEEYISCLEENGLNDSNYNTHNLQLKLGKTFNKTIRIDKLTNKLGLVVFPCNIDIREAYAFALDKSKACFIVEEAAHVLREDVLSILQDKSPLPYPMNAGDISRGEVQSTELLRDFFSILYTGSLKYTQAKEKTKRLVDSVSEDAMFAISNGMVKPAKHCLLGLGVKSMTGSEKLINVLNHFGHSIGYCKAEELETNLAMTVSETGRKTPDGIRCQEGLATGLAFDNFDQNTETLSGSGTLHDTVGIVYQNIDDNSSIPCESISSAGEQVQVAFRKRSFESTPEDIIPYRKKPKMRTFSYAEMTPPEPLNLQVALNRDLIWLVLSTLGKEVPMWAGWNSIVTKDKLPKQTVSYLQNISLPSTRLDVVAETMRIAQKVAMECNEEYALVTYDLAIAKPACQIQAEESPQFDNVFIMFGPFHIMTAYFSCIGTFIDGSGGDIILVDSEVLATGSLQRFLSGKHYNRCKRLHPMLASAFQRLHFRYFLDLNGPIPEGVLKKLTELLECPSSTLLEETENSSDIKNFLEKYQEFTRKTRNGDHGPTAAYWMAYVEMVSIYKVFSRACRTNDVDLFIYALNEITPFFFAMNKPNYARWMARYVLNLLNINETHPRLKTVLEQGALSVRRTNNSFARNPVDMTLEQTINADAASRFTGITAFQQNIAAKNRWAITRSARKAIVDELFEKAGMKKQDDVHKEVKKSRATRDNADLNKIIHSIEAARNPFQDDSSDDLYNIATGKATTLNVKNELINLQKTAQNLYQIFKEECSKDPSRFERSISRRKIQNFASAATKCKIPQKDNKIIEVKATRDLFGRLVYLASKMKLDLKAVFSYPLEPHPLCIAHIDGRKHSTDKSKLAKELIAKISTEPPKDISAYIVDAMYMIRSLDTKNLPSTYGGLASLILKRICRAPVIHFVCDTYANPSIKAEEHEKRGESDFEIRVTGPGQRRPKDMKAAFASKTFKKSLLSFLAREWSKDEYRDNIAGHTLYVSCGKECFRYTATSDGVNKTCVESMTNEHIEADTRIIFHLKTISNTPGEVVVIRSNDTDVLCILVYHMKTILANVFMDTGYDHNNTRKYIDLNSLSMALGPMCDALPGVHAFSGSDYTCAFMGKGKVAIYRKIESSVEYRSLFAGIGQSQEVTDKTLEPFERFVCDLYNKPNMHSLAEARCAIFSQKFAPTKESEPLAKVKGADSSTLPPSKSVLAEKVKRTNYVTMIWKNADKANPYPEISPTQSGWILDDGQYRILWFEGDQMPKDVAQNVSELIDNNNNDEEDMVLQEQESDDSDSDDDTNSKSEVHCSDGM